MEYLFVYGTLLTDIKNPMSDFLRQNSQSFDEGYFYGELYNVSWYPGAIVSADSNHKVFGFVVRLDDADNTLNILDDYEGIGIPYPTPHEYIRTTVSIFTDKHGEQNCWIYLYNHPVDGLEQIKSGKYLNYLENK